MLTLVLLALADRAESKAAAQMASGLAIRHGAGFAALHVSGPLGQEGGCVLQLPDESALGERRGEVMELLLEAMPPDQTADVMVAAGFAHVEILKAARVLEPDLLVLGAQGTAERCRQELTSSVCGTALLVAREAPCPVLALPSGQAQTSGPFERILACVDASHADIAAARHLLCFAARLAAREGAQLHVLHALTLPPELPTPGQEEMVRRVAASRERLAYLCHGLPGADRFGFISSEGAASVEILKHARERQADLLILAPGAGGDNGTVSRVLDGARCPVLLLGPGVLAAQLRQASHLKKG